MRNNSLGFIKISHKGFSLVEILIVISIIAILSGMILSFSGVLQKKTRDTQRESQLRVLQSALQQYYADQNKYPNSLNAELSSGSPFTNCSGRVGCTVTKTYLSQTPRDPSGASYYFRPVLGINSPENGCSIVSGIEIGTCHYYFLCSKMENASVGGFCYDSNYNFQLTPL